MALYHHCCHHCAITVPSLHHHCAITAPSLYHHCTITVPPLQIPLNEEASYSGGKVVYATRDGLVSPQRKAGSATIHDHTAVHGVSQHTSGIRYGLFFLRHLRGNSSNVPTRRFASNKEPST